jgi:hypothetical protein
MSRGARGQFHLDDERCFELLNSKGLGQIAFTQNAIPIIARLNFQVDNSTVYFRAPISAPLHRCFAQSVVALHADSIDPSTHVGWSVLVVGRSKIARAGRLTPSSLWAEEHLGNQLSDIRLVQMSADLIRASYFDSDGVISEYENYPFEAPSKAEPVGKLSTGLETDNRLVAHFPLLSRLE